MALLEVIKYLHPNVNVLPKKIGKRLGIYLNTVRRYPRSEVTEPVYTKRQSTSSINPCAVQFAGLLKTEAIKSSRQRRGLKQCHDGLVNSAHKRTDVAHLSEQCYFAVAKS